MSSCLERVDNLRHLLGLPQNVFVDRIGKAKTVYSMWKNGQRPDRDTLFGMADLWLIDYDSLWGRPGTSQLEPAPSLRAAQERLVALLSRTDTPGSPGERVIRIFSLLSGPDGFLPELTLRAWCDWLHLDESDWAAAELRPDLIGPEQVDGAAFLCGWVHGKQVWASWIETGRAAELQSELSRIAMVIAKHVAEGGMDPLEVRRRLNIS